ncbi:MAG: phospho-sugar mutase [Acidimicrobiales bacterium]
MAESVEDLLDTARAWMAVDPDPVTRAELQALIDAGDTEGLAERFDGRLRFGTAGIRGVQGAGPNRMNRVVVRRMAAGVGSWIGPGARAVVGYDARPNSDVYAHDLAAVLASLGVEAMILPTVVPTPVLAYAVRELRTTVGLMVTASHNPPADNGVKVFLADGAQLRAPHDAEIERSIDAAPLVGPTVDEPLPPGSVTVLDRYVIDRYVDDIAHSVERPFSGSLMVAYTPLHGVGRATLEAVFDATGLPAPVVAADQAEPDGTFPTVAFPNPEEPGAMDSLIATAIAAGADLAIANDPDADRLAVALPEGDRWRVLTGDEVGALLADRMLAVTSGPDRIVVSTVVCSSLVEKIATAAGVRHQTTLTGFKWIIGSAYADVRYRPVLAYEESLGYACTADVRDKDGISAALRFVELTEALAERGITPLRRLDELAVEHGLHATRAFSVRFDGAGAVQAAGAAVDRLRREPPTVLAGRSVTAIEDFAEGGWLPPTNLLRLDLDGGVRVLMRPSGTEPKTKVYLEAVVAVDDVDAVPEARMQALAMLDGLRGPLTDGLLAD